MSDHLATLPTGEVLRIPAGTVIVEVKGGVVGLSPAPVLEEPSPPPTDAELAWELRKVQDLIDDHVHGREVVLLPAALGAMKLLIAELKRLRPALNVNPDAASGAVP